MRNLLANRELKRLKYKPKDIQWLIEPFYTVLQNLDP